jgi:integrase
VRSLLRFLYVDGLIEMPLAQVVPTPGGWSGSSLPKSLTSDQLALLLGGCDRSSPAGRRDFAVLVLLARLGLRAGEVVALEVADIDWRAGEVRVSGKGPRVDALPLPAEVGRAIAAYLRRGRPPVGGGVVFRRIGAPHGPVAPVTVPGIVYMACDRAGLTRVGAHRLRHTAATEMLRAGGSRQEIAQVLRHDSPATTRIYAKVDRRALTMVAHPWPVGAA